MTCEKNEEKDEEKDKKFSNDELRANKKSKFAR